MKVSTMQKIQEKTKTIYQILETTCKTDGVQGVVVYGIQANYAGEFGDYMIIEDISANIHEVEQLLIRLNKEQVDSEQLIYIVEDYLVELSLV